MAKGKKKFEIKTPRGTIYTQSSKGGKATARLEWNPGFEPSMEKRFEKAQAFVDSAKDWCADQVSYSRHCDRQRGDQSDSTVRAPSVLRA